MMRSLTTLSALVVSVSVASAYGTVLTTGHTDIAPTYDYGNTLPNGYDPNGLGLNIHQDPTKTNPDDEDYDPSDTLLFAGANAIDARPSGSAFDFTGLAAGASYWHLTDDGTKQDSQLFLGIGMDDLDDALGDGARPFASYASKDSRYPGTDTWVGVSLLSFTGPGQVSAWESRGFGSIVELFSTADGLYGPTNSILTPEGGDHHFNWAFTKAGFYDLTFQTTAWYDTNGDGVRDAGDGFLQSAPTTLHFQMSPQAVPEPAPLAALGLGALALLRRRKR